MAGWLVGWLLELRSCFPSSRRHAYQFNLLGVLRASLRAGDTYHRSRLTTRVLSRFWPMDPLGGAGQGRRGWGAVGRGGAPPHVPHGTDCDLKQRHYEHEMMRTQRTNHQPGPGAIRHDPATRTKHTQPGLPCRAVPCRAVPCRVETNHALPCPSSSRCSVPLLFGFASPVPSLSPSVI